MMSLCRQTMMIPISKLDHAPDEMIHESSPCSPSSMVEETESSHHDSMEVDKRLHIPHIRIRQIENFEKPVVRLMRKNISTLDQTNQNGGLTCTLSDCPDNFPELLDRSPFEEKVNSELSKSTEAFMEKITAEPNNLNEEETAKVGMHRRRIEWKRNNIARLLDYDSDDVHDEEDSEYIPSTSDESEMDDEGLDNDGVEEQNHEDNIEINKHKQDKMKNTSKDESFDVSLGAAEPRKQKCDLADLCVEPSRGRKGDHKHHFCLYCTTLINNKFSRHLERHHKNEDDVRTFLALPKKSRERLKIIDSIRGKGDHEYNTNPEYNQGDLIVRRRPNEKNTRKSEDHLRCAKCKIWYSKSTLKTHFRECTKKKSSKRNALMMGRKLLGEIHPKAGPVLKQFIFPTIREDSVKAAIKYDELVIQFGNRLCKKYRSQHHHKEIRAQLRLCGRILLNVKGINPEITDFSSLYHPKYYEDVITAVNMTGRLDPSGTVYEAPATAAQAGTLIKKLAGIRKSNCIKLQLRDEKQNCEDFLHLMTDDYAASVSKTVEESQTLKKRQKSVKLPSSEDIKKLWEYLERQRKKAMVTLQSEVSYTNWLQLARPTLTAVQLFNRRRAGEVERIGLEDFQKCAGIHDFDKDLFNVLDVQAQKIAKTYSRFVIRGKLNRIVPVLLTTSLLASMKLLVKLRSAVGIPDNNPYVFGLRHGAHKARWEWLNACSLMRQFSQQCGANDPETLRGTKLRKHIATQCILLNLNSDEVSDLANFMGHHEKIHKEHYRQPIEARDILQISKLLEKASQGVLADGNLDEDSSEGEDDQGKDETISSRHEAGGSTEGKGLISGKSKKRKIFRQIAESDASSDESVSMHDTKRKRVKSKRKRDTDTTLEVSGDQEVVLTNRKVTDASKKKRKRRSTSPYGCVKRRRWSSDEVKTATELYSRYFKASRYPSLRQIAEDISKNPALKARTPAQIKTWISNKK